MTAKAMITGDTYRFRDIFRASPFYRWDAAAKAWYREYDTPVTVEWALRDVRGLSGICNRGTFYVEIVQ